MGFRTAGIAGAAGAAAVLWAGVPLAQAATTLTIATVNNGQMIEMQKLTPEFEKLHPDIHLQWVVLEENVLRQRVTVDIATKAGEFDVLTIGNYEVPIWGKQGWLAPFNDLPASYDAADLIPAIRQGSSSNGTLYALPFYGDGGVTYYRKDLFAKAGITMPADPSYAQIRSFADKITDRAHQVYGVCFRGKPGWGENMSYITPLVTAFGGQYFDMNWKPTIDAPAWHKALTFYDSIMKADGPPNATSNGFNESLALFQTGHCGIWVDASDAAGTVNDPAQSSVAGKVGFAAMPTGSFKGGPTFLWSWNLAIPSSSKHVTAAKTFVEWATSKDYTQLVASKIGWVNIPPGIRASSYQSPDYLKAAPFAPVILKAIQNANPNGQTALPRPYTGAQFVAIPEFQDIGSRIGQLIAATLSGSMTVDQALQSAQTTTENTMQQAGY